MYQLSTPLTSVNGIGPQLAAHLAKKKLHTVQDLLLFVPLRYEDRSQRATIAHLPLNEVVTIEAAVVNTSNYYKGPRSIQSATVSDETGRLKLMWFNNKFVLDRLKKGEWFLFSGKVNERGIMVQPVVEAVGGDTIHTDRLVPMYPQVPGIKGGSLRRLLKEVTDHLAPITDAAESTGLTTLSLTASLCQLHFPDQPDTVIAARERLALEELLGLMTHSTQLKSWWQTQHTAHQIASTGELIPTSIPFALTQAQHRSLNEIMSDLAQPVPMNRLLVGDVGSGKTVVAGCAARQVIRQGYHAALVAPTQILAQQHAQTIQKLLPDVPVELLTAQTKKLPPLSQPTLVVGTHAVINKLPNLQPGLVVYDEQHRFGVGQRSPILDVSHQPHLLTMTATPIPRTLMLTIFSHLQLSVIDELPAGRLPTKTWLVPDSKRTGSWEWMVGQIAQAKQQQQSCQILVVCPFIDPSDSEALENVAAVKDMYSKLNTYFAQHRITVGLLHGRQSKAEQASIIENVYQQNITVLVTTPIVEVGVDLPAASIMVIEAAERFGLASLHQLRGRVGRAGQQGYCLLFTNSKNDETLKRLQAFTTITNGSELAELDLQNRGAGDLFGTEQHGFDELRFASWTNVGLIHQAREVFEKIKNQLLSQPNQLIFTFEEKAGQKPLPN